MMSDANVAAASCVRLGVHAAMLTPSQDYFVGIIPMLQGNTVPCGESAAGQSRRL